MHYTVSEDSGPGQPVATLKATDPDTIGQLEYSLIKGDDGHFALDRHTGVLKLVDSLDRETKDVYKLTIRANDSVQYTDTVLTIQVSLLLLNFLLVRYHFLIHIILLILLNTPYC